MDAFEVVLGLVGLFALVGISIMIFRALMRPVIVLGVVAVFGWLLFFYEIQVDKSVNDVIVNENTEDKEGN